MVKGDVGKGGINDRGYTSGRSCIVIAYVHHVRAHTSRVLIYFAFCTRRRGVKAGVGVRYLSTFISGFSGGILICIDNLNAPICPINTAASHKSSGLNLAP
jgi:hypothetical protein